MRKIVLLAALSTTLLTACLGGGGTSATLGGAAPITPPTDPGTGDTPTFAGQPIPAAPPYDVTFQGTSQELAYTEDVQGQFTVSGTVTPNESGATLRLSQSDGVVRDTITSARTTTATLELPPGSETPVSVSGRPGIMLSNSAEGAATPVDRIFIYPAGAGWSYQAFDAWNIARPGGGTVVAASIGLATPVDAIPTSGTAVFNGLAGGFYVNPAGNGFQVGSALTANVDFAARTVALQTSGTINLDAPAQQMHQLNMSGTLSYQAGQNRFTGSVTTAGGGVENAALIGTATGSFFGPAAQEMGGTFGLQGTNAAFVGGFGARR